MLNKNDFLIAFLSCLIFLGIAFFISKGQPSLSNPDGLHAIHVAKNISIGDGLVLRRATEEGIKITPVVTKPPLFPILISTLTLFGADAILAAQMLVLLGYSLSVAVLFLIARQVLPIGFSLLATFIYGFQYSIIRYSTIVHEEIILVLFILVSLLILNELMSRCYHKKLYLSAWFALGILTGSCLLISYQGFTLVLVVYGFVVLFGYKYLHSIKPLASFTTGLAFVGFYPFLRFIWLRYYGITPSFIPGVGEGSVLLFASSFIHELQNLFFGKLLFWMYQADFAHYLALISAFLIFISVLLITSRLYKPIRPISLFLIVHITALLVFQISKGLEYLETRVFVPINGLILFVFVVFVYSLLKNNNRYIKILTASGSFLFLIIYAYGQFYLLNNLALSKREPNYSANYCNAPKTIEWAKENIPNGSIIISAQCGYQLLVDMNQYYWLPIPPADEYRGSTKYTVRWNEDDFVRINESTGASWIVLLDDNKGDPLRVTLGYGDYVEKLFNRVVNNQMIKKVGDFDDGVVYYLKK